jgi:hypothetical protein
MAFLISFDSCYNPFAPGEMHVDSSVYISIADGIVHGQIPYRDFADNKGPILYLLSAAGISLLGKNVGIWVIEFILMCISVLFTYKTALFFGNRRMALLGTFSSFLVFLISFIVAGGTEEYCLPLMSISMYLFTKYYFSKKKIRFIELVILGVCFSGAVLIRLNMFALWAGFCFVIFIESIIRRQVVLLIKYILGFCLGIFIVIIPVYFYLSLNGALHDFVRFVIVGGASKGFADINLKGLFKSIYLMLNTEFGIVPLVFGVFCLLIKYRKERYAYYIGYCIAFALTVLFISFALGNNHNNNILVPFFVPAFTFFISVIYKELAYLKHKNTLIIIFICVIFSEGIAKYCEDFYQFRTDTFRVDLVATGKMIDANTQQGDTIISLGINGYIYPFTERKAASKYIYQGSGIDLIPGAREDFLEDVQRNKPALIAVLSAGNGSYDYLPEWYAPIYTMMEQEYTLFSDSTGYYLFMKNR